MNEVVMGGIGTDATPGFSPNIWGRWQTLGSLVQRGNGQEFFEDFVAFPPHGSTSGGVVSGALGRGMHYVYQGGGITDGGVTNTSSVDLASDGDNEGAAWGGYTGFAAIKVDSGRRVMFESRVRTSTITDTKHNFFVGLIDPNVIAAGVPITTAGAVSDNNLIGFHRQEASTYGGYVDTVYKASGQTAVRTTQAQAITASTWMKLGFVFDGRIGVNSLKWYFNNVEIASPRLARAAMAAATFPKDTNLTFAIAVMNATGTTPGSTKFDWVRVGMEAVDSD